MCYTSLTLNLLGTVLTIALAAFVFMSHSVGNAHARALIKKMFKCCHKKQTDAQLPPTNTELYGQPLMK
jgi:hypothetical protein